VVAVLGACENLDLSVASLQSSTKRWKAFRWMWKMSSDDPIDA